jgi:calmodulin
MDTKTPKSASSDGSSVFFNQRSFGSDSGKTKPDKRNISKSKLREYRDAFSLFDKDGNGYLTKEELGHVMHQLGQWARMEELQEMLAEIDTDGDGNVSFEEFVEILLNITDSDQDSSAAQEEQELRDAFKVFDKHNRGYITASDLRAVLQCLGEDLDSDESKTNKFIRREDSQTKTERLFYLPVEDMIKEVDVDGDGRIDFEEFVRALGEPEDDESQDDDSYASPEPTPF